MMSYLCYERRCDATYATPRISRAKPSSSQSCWIYLQAWMDTQTFTEAGTQTFTEADTQTFTEAGKHTRTRSVRKCSTGSLYIECKGITPFVAVCFPCNTLTANTQSFVFTWLSIPWNNNHSGDYKTRRLPTQKHTCSFHSRTLTHKRVWRMPLQHNNSYSTTSQIVKLNTQCMHWHTYTHRTQLGVWESKISLISIMKTRMETVPPSLQHNLQD